MFLNIAMTTMSRINIADSNNNYSKSLDNNSKRTEIALRQKLSQTSPTNHILELSDGQKFSPVFQVLILTQDVEVLR